MKMEQTSSGGAHPNELEASSNKTILLCLQSFPHTSGRDLLIRLPIECNEVPIFSLLPQLAVLVALKNSSDNFNNGHGKLPINTKMQVSKFRKLLED